MRRTMRPNRTEKFPKIRWRDLKLTLAKVRFVDEITSKKTRTLGGYPDQLHLFPRL